MKNGPRLMSPALFRRRSFKGDLQTLLLRSCPPDIVDGSVSVPRLADALGITSQAIYQWIRLGKLPAKQAKALVAIAAKNKEPVLFEEFVDFLS